MKGKENKEKEGGNGKVTRGSIKTGKKKQEMKEREREIEREGRKQKGKSKILNEKMTRKEGVARNIKCLRIFFFFIYKSYIHA